MTTTMDPSPRTRARRLRTSATARRLLRQYDTLVECPKDQDAETGPSRVVLLAAACAQLSKAIALESQGQFGDEDATNQGALTLQHHAARMAAVQ